MRTEAAYEGYRQTFLSADHKNHIHVKIWEPEGNVQGVIQIAHGMIDYIERYTAMAEYFAKKVMSLQEMTIWDMAILF